MATLGGGRVLDQGPGQEVTQDMLNDLQMHTCFPPRRPGSRFKARVGTCLAATEQDS